MWYAILLCCKLVCLSLPTIFNHVQYLGVRHEFDKIFIDSMPIAYSQRGPPLKGKVLDCPGSPYRRERLNTVDLLVKIACFNKGKK